MSPYMGLSENVVYPNDPMVLLIIIPMKNGYFIGNINPTFSDKPIYCPILASTCALFFFASLPISNGGRTWIHGMRWRLFWMFGVWKTMCDPIHLWDDRMKKNISSWPCPFSGVMDPGGSCTRPGKRLHSYGKIHHFIAGKIHYFYGHFQ